ncbi:MAG: ATP-binding cassette domain-containing protein [candidate division Zixibacteria bacterium]|nr:ATP-binding cassette domain-containing protein [candidate division Zixibacteria bacterium]
MDELSQTKVDSSLADEPRPRVIELRDVSLKADRGGHVFRDLNLSVETGRSAVIIGSAGSGKTTLLELLIGLRFAETGTVEVFGREIRRRRRGAIRKIRRKIGGVGGPFGLMPMLTVSENICLPLVLAAERKRIKQERLLKMLTEFSLLKVASKYPSNLTRVETSMVQYARASIAFQPLLLIDEPSAGLDPHSYERIFTYLTREALSGRSMVIFMSEPPEAQIPNSDTYRLVSGALE